MDSDYRWVSPVTDENGLLMKREDLFHPFGRWGANGGKLRQCMALVDRIRENYTGIISACSIHSPQAGITAATAKHFGLPCILYFGGTTPALAYKQDAVKLAVSYGGKCVIAAHTGRHNVLYAKAKEYAEKHNYFVVEYGFNITEYPDLMFEAVSNQVQNIPDDLDTLWLTCGSGITAIGVLMGIEYFHKRIKEVHLVATAPDRVKRIQQYTQREFITHDIFHEHGFVYEKGVTAIHNGVKLHPQYEAKTYKEMLKNDVNMENKRNLLWIVGAEPKIRRG